MISSHILLPPVFSSHISRLLVCSRTWRRPTRGLSQASTLSPPRCHHHQATGGQSICLSQVHSILLRISSYPTFSSSHPLLVVTVFLISTSSPGVYTCLLLPCCVRAETLVPSRRAIPPTFPPTYILLACLLVNNGSSSFKPAIITHPPSSVCFLSFQCCPIHSVTRCTSVWRSKYFLLSRISSVLKFVYKKQVLPCFWSTEFQYPNTNRLSQDRLWYYISITQYTHLVPLLHLRLREHLL